MKRGNLGWPTTHGDTVEVYASVIGDGSLQHPEEVGWRYRVRARNHQIVETGSEGYTRRHAAVKAALRHHPRVPREAFAPLNRGGAA